MKEYFKLQFVLANRRLTEAGLNPFLGYLLALAGFIGLSEYAFLKTPFASYIILLTGFILLLRLSDRVRMDFFRMVFSDQLRVKIRLLENGLLCLPTLLVLLVHQCWLEAFLITLISISMAFYTVTAKSNFTLPTPFSSKPFEFTEGFRRTVLLFPAFYTLTIISFYAKNFNLGLVSLVFVFLLTSLYYLRPEQEFYVWIYRFSPAVFVQKKLLSATLNASALVAPVLVILLFCFVSKAAFIFLFFIAGILFLWTVILTKYTAFPGEINLQEGILIGSCVYFPPLLLFLLPYFYIKAVRNLNYLLDDKNQKSA